MTRAVTLAEIAAEEVLTVDGTNSRIGIGTTQPTTKLDVDGTISASDGMVVTGITTYQGDISIADKIIHTGDTNTSIRFPADDTVTIETAGSERVRVSSAGSFGIGTNNPASLLHVGSTSGGRIVFDPSAVSSGYECKIHPTDTGFEFSAGSNSRGFVFNTGVTPTPKLTISSTGLVGIGTDSPTEELHIAANVPGIRLEDIDNGYDSRILQSGASLYLDSDYNNVGSGAIRFRVSGTDEKMRIASSGNVGIGTDSPQQQINTYDNSNSGGILVQNALYAGNVDKPYLIASSQNHDGTTTNWGTFGFQHKIKSNSGGNGRITIDTKNGEAFCVTNAKNIGIGTDTPAETLSVAGNVRVENSADASQYLNLTYQGIDFQNTGAGSSTTSTAHLLDDYEEGTWTPVFRGATTAGSYTYGSQVGNYTKIGNKVTVTATLLDITTVSAGSGTLEISGLPFAQAGDFSSGDIYMAHFDVDNSTVSLSSRIDGSNSHILAVETRDALSGSVVLVTDKASNSADIIATITYFTNS